MNVITRRPVKTEGLDPSELERWIKEDSNRKAAIKCQILIALCNGNSMTDVCEMFNVTRESVRIWRNIIIKRPKWISTAQFPRTPTSTDAITKKTANQNYG